MITAVAPQGIQRLVAATAVTAVVLVGAATLASSWPTVDRGPTMTARFLLADLPNGITETSVGEWRVYLWRTGPELVAYSPLVEHGHAAVWCPDDLLFSEPLHHGVYEVAGDQVGPGGGKLMRYRVLLDGDEAIVDVSRIAYGYGTPDVYGTRWRVGAPEREAEIAAEACALV